MSLESLEFVEPETLAQWSAWLERNHATSPGAWVAIHKKATARGRLTYEEMVEEAVRWGWIDSTVHALDDERFRQLVTPRKPGSNWSRSNKARVKHLIEQGRMTPSGLAAVEAAQANGSWESLDEVDALVIPEDLATALASAGAGDGFSALSPSQRKMALYWIGSAKRDATRAARIAKTVEAALLGKPPL